MKCDGRYLVGPDNGILSPALLLPGAEVVSLPVPASASPTFHGRDIFAPAAIALASGIDISSLGMPTLQPVIRRTPEPQRLADGGLEGQVISIDRFGNAITNLMAVSVTAAAGRGGVTVDVAGRSVPIARTYSDVVSGQPCALIGSTGLMEIAVRDGSAATTLNLSRGAPVVLRAWHR